MQKKKEKGGGGAVQIACTTAYVPNGRSHIIQFDLSGLHTVFAFLKFILGKKHLEYGQSL